MKQGDNPTTHMYVWWMCTRNTAVFLPVCAHYHYLVSNTLTLVVPFVSEVRLHYVDLGCIQLIKKPLLINHLPFSSTFLSLEQQQFLDRNQPLFDLN